MSIRLDDGNDRQADLAIERVTLAQIVDKAARRLGDTANLIWERAELETYAQLGYEQFCAATEALWDSRHVNDRHSPTYTPSGPESTDAESYKTWDPWVPPAASQQELVGPTNYTETIVNASDPAPFLGDSRSASTKSGLVSMITAPADVRNASNTPPPRESFLPDDLFTVKRATWDGKRLQPLTPIEADNLDSQWEQLTGDTNGYAIVQRGGRKILKRYRGPAAPCDSRPYSQEVGFLVGGMHEPDLVATTILQASRITLTPFAIFDADGNPTGRVSTFYPYPVAPTTTIGTFLGRVTYGFPALAETANHAVLDGPWGIPCQISGAWATNGPWGIPIQYNVGARNFRIDYTKSPEPLTETAFEIQPWDTRYVLFFILARAFRRDGKGQNLKLAKHYADRFLLGIDMIKLRHAEVRANEDYVMGQGSIEAQQPFATLPQNWERERSR